MGIERSKCICGETLWDKHPEYQPVPGDFIMCIYCGAMLQLREDMTAVPLTVLDEVMLSPDVRAELVSMRRLIAIISPHARAALRRQRRGN